MKRVSVIIPMYNAEIFLDDLFTCFDRCDFQSGDEIIIVDNGSTDNSAIICQEQIKKHPDLYKLYTFTDKADSYASRNFGVKQATGDIFAFIDSDCKPTPNWLNTLRNINFGEVMAGEVELEVLGDGIWELYDSVAHLSQCEINASKNCVATANMSVNAQDFFKVGNFTERFSGGDFEWSNRAFKKGLKIMYTPAALVYHPSRKSYEEILKREERVAFGRGIQHKKNGGSLGSLVFSYLLRFFKLSTPISYAKEMKRRGASDRKLFVFHIGFFWIRWKYVVFAVRGFCDKNPRDYGIK